MSKYVEFRKHAPVKGRKTALWGVYATSGIVLGQIRWRPTWRKYCFYPLPDRLFDTQCLRDIGEFMSEETRKHYAIAKEAKNAAGN